MVLYNIFWRRDDLACVHMYICMPKTQRYRFNLFVITPKPYFDILPSLIFRVNWHDEYNITFDLEIICIRKVSFQTIIQMFAHKVERHHWNLAIPSLCWCLPNNKEIPHNRSSWQIILKLGACCQILRCRFRMCHSKFLIVEGNIPGVPFTDMV